MIRITMEMVDGTSFDHKIRTTNPDQAPGLCHLEEVERAAKLLQALNRDHLLQLSGDNVEGDSSKFEEAFFINPRNVVRVRVYTQREGS
jgi:hypothetical protein